jgi:hypothetical protein
MTTRPAVPRRPACLPGGITGYPGQLSRSAGDVEFAAHADGPFAVYAALTTASCPAQVRTWPVSGMMLSRVPAFPSLPPGTAADSRSPGGTWPAGQVSHEL